MSEEIRAIVLQVINEKRGSTLTQDEILKEVNNRIKGEKTLDTIQAILTEWQELFRTGQLAWGWSLADPYYPYFHLTERGNRLLKNVSRDPGNPLGYMKYVQSVYELDEISKSYLEESLNCYVSGLYKASAVMIGAATENILLLLRDKVAPIQFRSATKLFS